MARPSKGAGHGRVRLRKRGTWWYARFQDKEQRREITLNVHQKPRAEKIAQQIDAALEAGEPWRWALGQAAEGERTFQDAVSDFLEHGCRWSAETRRGNSGTINQLLAEFGNTPLSQIDRRALEAYLAKRRSRGATAGTSNRYLATLKAIYKTATAWGYIKADPTAGIKALREDAKLPRPYAPDETERIRAVLQPLHAETFDLYLQTGLRRGEMMRLSWQDIDWDARELRIVSTKSGRDRIVPMTDRVAGILQRMKRRRASSKVARLDNLVLGKSADIRQVLDRAITRAGIDAERRKALRPLHSCRDTCLTALVRRGTPLDRVQKIAGHENIAMTLRYAQTANTSLHDAMRETFG